MCACMYVYICVCLHVCPKTPPIVLNDASPDLAWVLSGTGMNDASPDLAWVLPQWHWDE